MTLLLLYRTSAPPACPPLTVLAYARYNVWQVMMEVMQLTSAWDALTSRICWAVLNTWLDGPGLRSRRSPLAGSLKTGQTILRWLNPIKALNPKKVKKKTKEDYEADIEKGMKIDWLGILDTPASMAGTTLALKKAAERVEKWATSDVLRWLVEIDEKSFLGLFAEKRVTGPTLLMFVEREGKYDVKYKKLQTFVIKNSSAPPHPSCLASPCALHIAHGLLT